jgi:hypothetical protein
MKRNEHFVYCNRSAELDRFRGFGEPREIRSNSGQAFVSPAFHKLLSSFGIDHRVLPVLTAGQLDPDRRD